MLVTMDISMSGNAISRKRVKRIGAGPFGETSRRQIGAGPDESAITAQTAPNDHAHHNSDQFAHLPRGSLRC